MDSDNWPMVVSFCERWIRKAQRYETQELEDLVDKFFTYFVAYNRLYSEISKRFAYCFEQMPGRFAQQHGRRSDVPARSKKRPVEILIHHDNVQAIVVMRKVISTARFAELVGRRPEIREACARIELLLTTNHFFLYSQGRSNEPDRKKNSALAAGLANLSLGAVLACLYQIRCNIFHGEKELAPQQEGLLRPANMLLEAILALGLELIGANDVLPNGTAIPFDTLAPDLGRDIEVRRAAPGWLYSN